MQLFELYATLGLDDKDFRDGVVRNKKLIDDMAESGKNGASGLKSMFNVTGGIQFSQFLNKAKDVLASFAKESISLASDLQEVQNVVDVTFGEDARRIDAWAKSAKNAFGMSELKAKQYTGTIGAMLKSMGLADDQVVEMATSVVGLTGDMASFYNLEHEAAFEKIRSGLSGEIEPLRSLGINLSAANMEAFALAEGIEKAYSDMTMSEQTLLRYSKIMKDTSSAQGDFRRTSGDYANEMRTLRTSLDEKSAVFGDVLIAAITPAVAQVNDLLDPGSVEDELKVYANTYNERLTSISREAATVNQLLNEMDKVQKNAVESSREWERSIKAIAQNVPDLRSYLDNEMGLSTDSIRQYMALTKNIKTVDAAQDMLDSYRQAVSNAEADVFNADVQATWLDAQYDAARKHADEFVSAVAKRNGVQEWEIRQLLGMQKLTESGKYSDDGKRTWEAKQSGYFTEEELDSTILDVKQAVNSAALARQEHQTVRDLANQNLETAKDYLDTAEQTYASLSAESKLDADFDAAITRYTEQAQAVRELGNQMLQYRNEFVVKSMEALKKTVSGFDMAPILEDFKRSAREIQDNLRSQTRFYEDYAENLAIGREIGLSNAVLAELSGGSAQNAADLDALIEAAREDQTLVASVNQDFEAREAAFAAAAQSMATNQLNVDEAYASMSTEFNNVFSELQSLATEASSARTNMEEAACGMADAFALRIPEVQSSVDSIKSIIDQLNGYSATMNVYLNTSPFRSALNAMVPTIFGRQPGSNAKGLDRVPYDNYLTYLHKDETVLPRPEAESYRAARANPAISPEAFGDIIGERVYQAIKDFTVNMDSKAVGSMVAPTVSGQIAHEIWRDAYA